MGAACPKCKYENRDDALFCNLCKTILRRDEAEDTTPNAQARAETPDDERIDLALIEAARLILEAMPPAPRETKHRVTLSVENAKFPDQCPGCGEHAGSKLELTSRRPALTFRVPFCWRCVQLIEKRRRHLAIRAAVVGGLMSLMAPIHLALATIFAVELARIAYLAATRAWLFGARLGPVQLDSWVLEVDHALFAAKLADLNAPRPREAPLPLEAPAPVPAAPLEDDDATKVDAPIAQPRSKPLPTELGPALRNACDEAETLMRDRRWVQALVKYDAALAILPQPHEQWRIAKRIFTAQGDAYFQLHEWKEAVRCMTAARSVEDRSSDAFVLLRLGQAQLELGDKEAAAETLEAAHKLGGDVLFSKEDAKYRTTLSKPA